MRQLLQLITATLARLSKREQRLLALFVGLAAVAALVVFVIEPLTGSRERLERRIETLQGDTRRMEQLGARIRHLQKEIGREATPTAAREGFSLFSFIDKATSASVNREAVASMNPSRRSVREGFEENAVELRLSAVTLPEVVALLREIEEATAPVYIKRLDLKRRYDDRTRFDGIIVAGSVSRS